jgi:hypothetical protein
MSLSVHHPLHNTATQLRDAATTTTTHILSYVLESTSIFESVVTTLHSPYIITTPPSSLTMYVQIDGQTLRASYSIDLIKFSLERTDVVPRSPRRHPHPS